MHVNVFICTSMESIFNLTKIINLKNTFISQSLNQVQRLEVGCYVYNHIDLRLFTSNEAKEQHSWSVITIDRDEWEKSPTDRYWEFCETQITTFCSKNDVYQTEWKWFRKWSSSQNVKTGKCDWRIRIFMI